MAEFNINHSSVNQINESGDNVQNTAAPEQKTFWDYFCTWYGLLGTTITIGSFWCGLHATLGWWFFGVM